jgi:hypothetical protein
VLDEIPTTPPPPAPAPKRGGGLAVLLIGALLGAVIGIGGARFVVPAITTGAAPTASNVTAEQAIRDVIQKANEAQAAAFAKHEPSAMRATSTDTHYQEMVKINKDLASVGVRSIELVKIAFGDVTVNGSTATATTTETWRSTFSDGSVDQRTDENDYSLVLQDGSWKIDSNSQPANTDVTAPTQPQAPAGTSVRNTSRNWSGYVSTGGTYTSVSGTWVVAKPDPKVAGVDATWVGIGGANTTDLIQAGTEATVSGDGTVSYEAWTEVLPQSTHAVALSVSGGDTVSVSITEQSAGLWLIDLRNVTTGRSFTTTLRYASSRSSAEWIEEAPSVGRGVAPLDSFGSVAFSAASAVVDGKRETLGASNAKPVTMANGPDQPLAVPSPIGKDGTSFTVTRTANPATSSFGGPGRRRG